MTKRLIQIVISTAIVGLVVFSQSVYAESEAYAMEKLKKNGEKRFEKLAKELNLSEEQRQELKTQREQQQAVVKPLHKEFRNQMENLKTELEKPETNRIRVKAITTKIKTLGGELLDQRVEGILAMKQVLTPEQFKKLSEKREAKKKKFKKLHRQMMKERDQGELY